MCTFTEFAFDSAGNTGAVSTVVIVPLGAGSTASGSSTGVAVGSAGLANNRCIIIGSCVEIFGPAGESL